MHVQRKCHSLSAHPPASLPESPVTIATSEPHHLFLTPNFMPVTCPYSSIIHAGDPEAELILMQ